MTWGTPIYGNPPYTNCDYFDISNDNDDHSYLEIYTNCGRQSQIIPIGRFFLLSYLMVSNDNEEYHLGLFVIIYHN